MKKIYVLLIALLALSMLNAQTWDFGSTEFFEIGDITSDTTISGLTIYATSEKQVTFGANGKSIDGYEFTGRLKFNGSNSFSEGTPVARVIGFEVPGDCAITVYGCSSSSSSERMCMFATAGGELLDSLVTTDIASKTVSYAGEATTIYLYSASSGFNLYQVMVVTDSVPLVEAEDVAWDFGSSEFFEIGDITSDTTISGLTVYATSEKAITFGANGKSIDEYEFTGRLKFNGSNSFSEGAPIARVVGFEVSGDCNITVYGCSSSSSSERICMIANVDGELLDSLVTTDIASKTLNYTGEATSIYMYSKSSGFNLYLISVSYGEVSAALNENTIGKEILMTKYYTLNGVCLGSGANFESFSQGIYLKVLTFTDGTSLTTKELKAF